jgi:hypothetical protein
MLILRHAYLAFDRAKLGEDHNIHVFMTYKYITCIGKEIATC